MIAGFRHKGPKLLYDKGDRRRIKPEYVNKVERILARLDEAAGPADMDLPGFRLHPLKGNYAGYWAVDVSGNWRVVFRFEGVNVYDVELTDYH